MSRFGKNDRIDVATAVFSNVSLKIVGHLVFTLHPKVGFGVAGLATPLISG